MINKYGLKMNGLKAAAGETSLVHCRYGNYIQIAYDRNTGDIVTRYHVSTTDWTIWNDPDIVDVINTQCKLTMQDIADAVRDTLDAIAARKAWTPCY